MRRLARLAVSFSLAVTAAVAAPGAAHAAGCAGADSAPAAMTASAANHATLCLLNQQRRSHGLRAFKLNGKLGRAATGHARDMVAKRYFDHTSKSGASFGTRIKRSGWTNARRSYTIGENIGWGGGSLATPRAMVRAWMGSAGHRANILSRSFRMIGIGIANGAPNGSDGATYATDFGG
jgi:uncharacterized protein YkwD